MWRRPVVSDEDVNDFFKSDTTMSQQNALVVGMKRPSKPGALGVARDMARIEALEKVFQNVFSMAPAGNTSNENHIDGKIGPRVLDRTFKSVFPNKLDYILLDYVHMTPSWYADNLLAGSPQARIKEPNAGKQIIDFVKGCKARDILNLGCKLILAEPNKRSV